MPKERVLISLSGGLDSTVLLAYLKQNGFDVSAVGFCYGSKHNVYENKAAEEVADHYGVPFRLIDISPVMRLYKSDLLLSGGAIPEGHYEAESMKRTVVPCRNMIFASVLAGQAESDGRNAVYLGVHRGDHHIYPDCRPRFLQAMTFAVREATDGKVDLHAPFLHMDKGQIVRLGHDQQVPFHLTRTCYKAQAVACGKCGSCGERLEAFKANGLRDPLAYGGPDAGLIPDGPAEISH